MHTHARLSDRTIVSGRISAIDTTVNSEGPCCEQWPKQFRNKLRAELSGAWVRRKTLVIITLAEELKERERDGGGRGRKSQQRSHKMHSYLAYDALCVTSLPETPHISLQSRCPIYKWRHHKLEILSARGSQYAAKNTKILLRIKGLEIYCYG